MSGYPKNVICFNIDEEYSFYVPWATKPEVKFFGVASVVAEYAAILSGEPTIIINGRPIAIKVWKVTILPLKIHCNGTYQVCNREYQFSTFRKIK